MALKFGRKAFVDDPRDLRLETYLITDQLPSVRPHEFGNDDLYGPRAWGMLGNSDWGCCVEAGAAHETMALTTLGQHASVFDDASVLSDYSAVTGFDPNAGPSGNNPTDNGTDIRTYLKYRQSTGILDANGNRHKIGAYVRVQLSNLQHVYWAMYLFENVTLGINFPDSAMTQFNEGVPWSPVPGSQIEGGHCVDLLAKRTHLRVITWGAVQDMTVPFYRAYTEECWCSISQEDLVNNLSPQGFDMSQLRADLALLNANA